MIDLTDVLSALSVELATAAKYSLGVKIVVLNNSSFGQIKWKQMAFLGNVQRSRDPAADVPGPARRSNSLLCAMSHRASKQARPASSLLPGERHGDKTRLPDHNFLEPGSLLDGRNAGEFYESCWAMAQADSFDPIPADPRRKEIMV